MGTACDKSIQLLNGGQPQEALLVMKEGCLDLIDFLENPNDGMTRGTSTEVMSVRVHYKGDDLNLLKSIRE